MKQLVTRAIILRRTDYGEADRILILLTPDYGKLSLVARGVRRVKSKLAGGIELFSVSTITFAKGRSDLGTLVSARLVKHYGTIVQDLDRTMLGYELIKEFSKNTEDHPGPEYFGLLEQAFEALDDAAIPLDVIRLWFWAQLLRLGGLEPNLQTDTSDRKLQADMQYQFDNDAMAFAAAPEQGRFNRNHIKLLRLAFAGHKPKALAQVQDNQRFVSDNVPLVQGMLQAQ